MATTVFLTAVLVLIVLLAVYFRKRRIRVKKYPEYLNINDEYIDALKEMADKKVNRRFLTRGRC